MNEARFKRIIGLASVDRKLDLKNKQLTSLPESIGDLTSLTSVDLRTNRLASLPESISNLTRLTHLYLSSNQLTSLPKSITNLINLTDLDSCDNPIVDFSILQDLPNLKKLFF